MKHALELLESLVSLPSVTPHDADCQALIMNELTQLGFSCQTFNNRPVSNFYAHIGNKGPLLIFAGHTDVVPAGDLNLWLSDPFKLSQRGGKLYGRGVADMKGSLACMISASAQLLSSCPNLNGQLGFLITSGEEGDHFDLGTPFVMKQLQTLGIQPNYCIVGEPSSHRVVGDVIKIGRRGSLTLQLRLAGKQGHVAYPHLAKNPIHSISPVLAELSTRQWDEGNEFFPPTSMQITHIHSSGPSGNVIPGELELNLNFRFSTEQRAETLKKEVQAYFHRHKLKPSMSWRLNGEPFLTSSGRLLEACIKTIEQTLKASPELSTSGGTSDGRFIAPFGVEVIELGLVNNTIHQVNECIDLAELSTLTHLYFLICKALFT